MAASGVLKMSLVTLLKIAAAAPVAYPPIAVTFFCFLPIKSNVKILLVHTQLRFVPPKIMKPSRYIDISSFCATIL